MFILKKDPFGRQCIDDKGHSSESSDTLSWLLRVPFAALANGFPYEGQEVRAPLQCPCIYID